MKPLLETINELKWLLKDLMNSFSFSSKLRERLCLMIYLTSRIISLTLRFLDKKIYYNFWSRFHKLFFPFPLRIMTFYGIFECRKGHSDVAYVLPSHERNLMKIFNLRKGIFIDVGAHIGRYSIMVGKRLRNGKVIAIEPARSNFELLVRNIKINGLENKVLPLNIAISDEDSISKLFAHKGSGDFSLLHKSEKFQKVITKKLDNVIRELKITPKDIKLIKIDVEGSEEKVLHGSFKILREGKPMVILECTEKQKQLECFKVLKNFGYTLLPIDEAHFIARKG